MTTYETSLRDTLLAFLAAGHKTTLAISTSAGLEFVGHLRAVTEDTVIIGAAKKPYHVALAQIVAVQEV